MDIYSDSNGILNFQGQTQQLTITLINPYSGQEIEFDEEINLNSARYFGTTDFNRIIMTNNGDALFLEDRNSGEQNVFDVDFIVAQDDSDIVNFASETIDYSQNIIINGGFENDILWGNTGDDSIAGASGDDNLDGGPGNDTLFGDDGDDTLYGGEGDDKLHGDRSSVSPFNVGNDTVYGGNGDDLITGGYGEDSLFGGAGHDIIKGEIGADIIEGGAGNDIIEGGSGDDIIYGGTSGDDTAFIELKVLEHNFSEALIFPTLIERKNIDKLDPPGTANLGVTQGDLSVSYQTSAKITFLESGAGYKNTLGFYSIAENGTIQSAEIAFENVHKSNLPPGVEQSLNLPGDPDSDFGFFIISNGFRKNQGYRDLDLDNPDNISFVYKHGTAEAREAKITDHASDIDLVYNDGQAETILRGDSYHTHTRGGATNLNIDGQEHVVTGLTEEGNNEVLRIGFEDLRNTGDADYNDVVFDLEVKSQITVEQLIDDNDVIDAGEGNDIIVAGYGDDILSGGKGQDTFLYQALTYSLDTITDFESGTNGDHLNITDLLEGYDPVSDAITDFVKITENNAEAVISVDTNGGADKFTEIVKIEGGLNGASLQDLINSENLVVDQSIVL